MVMLSATLLTSCKSSDPVPVYKTVITQTDFPTFPRADNIINNNDGTCTVPSEWIVKLAEYSIRIQEIENNYREIEQLYEDK